MGIKSFHVVFIVASIVLSFLVGAWGIQQYRAGAGTTPLMIAGLFYATGLALAFYCTRFLRKVRELEL